MSKINALISIALAEVGTREGPNNDNKYGREYGFNFVAWCCIFIWWCFHKAGLDELFPKVAHCNQVEAYAKERNAWVTNDYKVGDLVIFDYNKDLERDHIGLVIEVDGGRVKTTVEGNYADMVAKVNRRTDCSIIGAYRPNYGAAEISTGDKSSQVEEPAQEPDNVPTAPDKLPNLQIGDYGPAVQSLQGILRCRYGCRMPGSFYADGTADGEFGEETERMVQAVIGKNTVSEEDWDKLIGGLG